MLACLCMCSDDRPQKSAEKLLSVCLWNQADLPILPESSLKDLHSNKAEVKPSQQDPLFEPASVKLF
jgi:hypothetical protein